MRHLRRGALLCCGCGAAVAFTPTLVTPTHTGVRKSTSLYSAKPEASFTRREILGSAALLGGALLNSNLVIADEPESRAIGGELNGERLVWSPRATILRRAKEAGGRAAPTSNSTFNTRFITYLSRFLLNYDEEIRRLWYQQGMDLPVNFSAAQVEEKRREQFAAFSRSVQVGLLDYQGEKGARALFSLMRSRYGADLEQQKQLAILFSFVQGDEQPTNQMQTLLGECEDAYISGIQVIDSGNGYAEGDAPEVRISPPQFGKDAATAEVVMHDTGEISRIDLLDNSCSALYDNPPRVNISPPVLPNGRQATAEAILDQDGRIEAIELLDGGAGYSSKSVIEVEVFGPTSADNPEPCQLTIQTVLGWRVDEVEITNPGSGYATSVPVTVTIDPPAGEEGTSKAAIALTFPQVRQELRMPYSRVPLPASSMSQQLTTLIPSYLSDSLVFDAQTGTYEPLKVTDDEMLMNPATTPMFDPVFGPIGRSPLDREYNLTPDDYFRFALSGAFCTAVVRCFLSPLDNIKTKAQVSVKYGDNGGGLLSVIDGMKEEGDLKSQLIKGIDISTILGLLLGFFGFGCNELFKRQLNELIGPAALINPVPVILVASAGAQFVNCLVSCPWETMRIQVMTSDEDFRLGSFLEFGKKIYEEDGIAGFYSAFNTLCFRELPFAIVKFLVFDQTRSALFQAIPAAQEQVLLSLAVSVVAGMLAGVAGAIVSNPADALLTRINVESSALGRKVEWQAVVRGMQVQEGGFKNLFNGVSEN
ncbi:unnamed protein product [Chrysoparadoxa australica]